MKKGIIALIIAVLVLNIGCSSKTEFNRERFANISEEERQEMMQERMQVSIDACKDKVEGDVCSITSPRGDIEGKCTIQEENMVCINPNQEFRRQK